MLGPQPHGWSQLEPQVQIQQVSLMWLQHGEPQPQTKAILSSLGESTFYLIRKIHQEVVPIILFTEKIVRMRVTASHRLPVLRMNKNGVYTIALGFVILLRSLMVSIVGFCILYLTTCLFDLIANMLGVSYEHTPAKVCRTLGINFNPGFIFFLHYVLCYMLCYIFFISHFTSYLE